MMGLGAGVYCAHKRPGQLAGLRRWMDTDLRWRDPGLEEVDGAA